LSDVSGSCASGVGEGEGEGEGAGDVVGDVVVAGEFDVVGAGDGNGAGDIFGEIRRPTSTNSATWLRGVMSLLYINLLLSSA
jgi:hypothetical protein